MSSSAVASSAAALQRLPTASAQQLAAKACTFLTNGTDPFHVVQQAIQTLEAAGFVAIPGGLAGIWTPNSSASSTATPTTATTLVPGGKYYYTVQNSTLVAFAVGSQVGRQGSAGGFHIIGGHTDSPNFRIKPRSIGKASSGTGVTQLAVECYGGGLWHTWFDRDLSVSGKVLVRSTNPATTTTSSFPTIEQRLVQLRDPIARVSTLCIHLQSPSEREAFKVNKEDHTSPIIASSDAILLNSSNSTSTGIGSEKNTNEGTVLETSIADQINGTNDPWLKGQEPLLLQRIAQELNIDITQIADYELSLYDTQPATIGGMRSEFLYSARLDNVATVFTAITALADYSSSTDNSSSNDIAMVVCFDHEEVGSVSAVGAGSPVIHEAVQSISAALWGGSNNNNDATASSPQQHAQMQTTLSKSFCLSIDQAHAIHPNYAAKHDSRHAPVMNGGIVIKTNSNQRYTSNSLTSFVLRELGRKANVPIQEFCVRNDCPCGSTIGPTISALTGIRTVDAGMPQLSMHSCREVMGIQDLQYGYDLFTAFFTHFRDLDTSIQPKVSS